MRTVGSGLERAGLSSRSTLGSWVKQPPNLLLLQAGTLYIVLMLLADGHTAARITLPQIHQIPWLGIKSGVQRETESVLRVVAVGIQHFFFSC